jgi:hypothetical protein
VAKKINRRKTSTSIALRRARGENGINEMKKEKISICAMAKGEIGVKVIIGENRMKITGENGQSNSIERQRKRHGAARRVAAYQSAAIGENHGSIENENRSRLLRKRSINSNAP